MSLRRQHAQIPVPPGVSHEQVLRVFEAQVGAGVQSPRLRGLLGQPGEALFPRFAQYYEHLRGLPRRVRRMLQRRYARPLAGVALLLALGQAPALAANIDVDGAACTVANAIRSANTDTATGGCPVGSGTDTLVLVVNSTHTLTAVEDTTYGNTGLPLVTSQITIAGNNSTIERGSAAAEFRILAVGPTGNLTLQALTLTGGHAARPDVGYGGGGGVFNAGILTVTDSTVSGNTANLGRGGGVFNAGILTVTDSTVSGNTARGVPVGGDDYYGGTGGGVSNDGILTLTNSTVSGNTVNYYGGGVFNRGTLTLANSTVSGNTGYGGGVSNHRYGALSTLTNSTVSGNNGGGVINLFEGILALTNSTVSGNTGGGVINFSGGILTLTDSTISGNTAGRGGGVLNGYGNSSLILTNSTVSGNMAGERGGGVFNGYTGTLTLTNSTISGNTAGGPGGGVYNYGGASLDRNLVSGNTAPNASEAYNFIGPYDRDTLHADNFNLFGTNGDAGVVGFTPGPTDIVPAAGVTLADILDPLADNGGPTQTHALVFGSPASEASPIDKHCAATDQRGVFRPQGPACDIGAFEAGVEPDPFASPTPTPGCTVNGVPDQLCQGTPGPDRIIGTLGNDVIVGLDGDDHVNGGRGDNRVFGGPGNDRIIGGRRKGDDQFFGQAGDDDLRGYAGNDLLDGGNGNDRLKAHEGDDQLRGGEGDDALRGLEGNDTLEGGNGRDLLRGGPGTDSLEGGPGADKLNGGAGTDSCASDAEDKIVVLCP